MTADVESATAPGRDAPDAPEAPERRPSIWRRLGHAYLYGQTGMLVLLAFVSAAVVGAIFIVIADAPTRQAAGYFFQHPSDTFSRGWHAISAAYSALFEGSIFNTNSLYSNGGVPVLGPLSETLTYGTPLILGGLAVGDPAVDLMVAWELLDPSGREELRVELEVDDATWLRGRAWALAVAVMTLPYYWHTMPGRCADRLVMARAVLSDRTLPDPTGRAAPA